jgi:hypothetical protein
MNKQPKVFISYAKENSLAARKLYSDLLQLGANPWLDAEDLLPGQPWRLTIKEEIRNSDFIIVLLSNESVNKRGFVQKEIKDAIDILDEFPEGEIYLIPARLTDCQPRNQRIKDLQWVDLFPDWQKGIMIIGKSLSLSSTTIPMHDLSGTWKGNLEIKTIIEQEGNNLIARYSYPRFYAAPWAMYENFPQTTLKGIIENDIVLFHFEDPVEKTVGIGFWKVESEDKLNGYWFWQSQELNFDLVLKRPEIILNKDIKEGNYWELKRIFTVS